MPDKAKKVAPPTDMDTHNRQLKEAAATQEDVMPTADTTLSAKEVAEELGTDPRTLRKFLRSDKSGVSSVGQGKRYTFTPKSVKGLKAKFDVWSSAKAEKPEAPEVEETDFEAMTIPQLKDEATSRGITIPSKAKKADIVTLLLDSLE